MDSCRSWSARLSAWFDGECSDMDAAEVRAHLLQCPGCRATASRWSALRQDLSLLDAPEPPAEVLQRMAVGFEQGLAREVLGLSQALRTWRMAAALVLAVGLGFLAADRLFLPGPARASAPRDFELELRDLLERPSGSGPTLLQPAPKPGAAPTAPPAQAPGPG